MFVVIEDKNVQSRKTSTEELKPYAQRVGLDIQA